VLAQWPDDYKRMPHMPNITIDVKYSTGRQAASDQCTLGLTSTSNTAEQTTNSN